MTFIYKRIVLKISGEVIKGFNKLSYENDILKNIIQEVKELILQGVEISIVIGGGNLFRGSSLSKMDINRVTADYIGMLSTVINGLFLKDLFNKINVPVCLMSSVLIHNMCNTYNLDKAKMLLSKSVVVIFCGGMGHPYFTTDSAACLKAIETQSDIILKGTTVDGVYSKDPKYYNDVILYNKLSYNDILSQELKVMDLTAFILARDHKIPICIFNIYTKNVLKKILQGYKIGTMVL